MRMRRRRKTPTDSIQSVERAIVLTRTKLAGDSGLYQSVRLVDFPSASEFTSLFQYYRIRRVQFIYTLVNAPNNNATFPTLYVAPQAFQTSGVPGSRDEVMQFQGLKIHQFGPSNLTKTVTCVPLVTRDMSNQISGGELVKSPWLSTANSANQHLSFVDWISRYNSTGDSSHTLEVQFRIWIDLKRTR
jgi:hypothetical protein